MIMLYLYGSEDCLFLIFSESGTFYLRFFFSFLHWNHEMQWFKAIGHFRNRKKIKSSQIYK